MHVFAYQNIFAKRDAQFFWTESTEFDARKFGFRTVRTVRTVFLYERLREGYPSW